MLALDILGLGCLLPDADSLDTFWANLLAGKRSIRTAVAADWGIDPNRLRGTGSDRTPSIEIASPSGYTFDPHGYHLPAEFLAAQDRCLQWPLAVARDALRDAGLWPADKESLARTGLLLGSYAWAVGAASDALTRPLYEQAIAEAFDAVAPQAQLRLATGRVLKGTHAQSARIGGGLVRGIAGALGLGGPRYSLDAACATSLYALRLAALHIAAGEADAMLVVAANGFDPLYANLGFAATQALPDGIPSRPFDARSTGLAPGEGAVAMLVRRAVVGTSTYGVIRAVGLSSDGNGKTLTAPNTQGQQLACERAYADAGVAPSSVSYVECHATGTQMGDRVELETMSAVFGPGQAVGSVKSNLGHLLTAAGAAGLVKTVLAMREGVLPPTAGIEQPLSSEADIVCELRAWPDGLRRAAVNAFGFGGVNAHLVVDAPGTVSTAIDHHADTNAQRRVEDTAAPPLLTGLAATVGDCANLDAIIEALQQAKPRLRDAPPATFAGLPFVAPRGAYLERVAIDALRLRLPPKDLERLHPQQPLMLAVGDAALRDAGIAAGTCTAVIIAASMDHSVHRLLARWESGWRLADALAAAGLSLSDEERGKLDQAVTDALHTPADAAVALGYIGNLLASRIASAWDFSGPAFTLSGDETTALRALDLGARMLAEGVAQAVLVGAIDLGGTIENLLVRHANGESIQNPLAEGACALVLEPAATHDQARAYAQWLGAGFADSLADAAQRAGQRAGLAEGTPVGLFEVGALPAAALAAPLAEATCPALASSAAIFGDGHMLTPLLGVLNAALALNARRLPGWAGSDTAAASNDERTAAFGTPAALAALGEGRAYVPTGSTPWFRPAGALRHAAVLARDPDGSAAHALLREAPAGLSRSAPTTTLPLLLTITAQTRDELLARLRELIAAPAQLGLRARQTLRGYDADAPLALALLADDVEGLLEEARAALAQLPAAQEWQSPRGSRFSAAPLGREGGVAFVYSPLNTAFCGLARGVGALLPGALDKLDAGYRDAGAAMGASLLYPQRLAPLDPETRMQIEQRLLTDNHALIGAGVLSSWLYTRLLTERIGIEPAAVFGHSLGQLSMLFANDVWEPGDAWTARLDQFGEHLQRLAGDKVAVREHWQLADDQPLEWANYLLLAPADAVKAAAAGETRAYVSLVNAPDEVTLIGEQAACARVLKKLGIGAISAPDSLVVHCDPAQAERAGIAAVCTTSQVGPASPALLFAGGAPASWTPQGIAERIADDLVSPLDFAALTEQAYARSARLFVEMGPGANCSRWIGKTLHGRPHVSFAMSRRDQDDVQNFGRLVALLVAHRVPLDMARVWGLADESNAPAKPALYKELKFQQPALAGVLADNLRRLGVDQALQRAAGKSSNVQRESARVAAVLASDTRPAASQPNLVVSVPAVHQDTSAQTIEQRSSELSATLLAIAARRAQAHGAWLEQHRQSLTGLLGPTPAQAPAPATHGDEHSAKPAARRHAKASLYNESDVMEFAEGRISHVFGPAYAAADQLPRRLRLPGPPFLALSRVTEMSGTHGQLHRSRIRTEFDVPDPAWNAVDGQTCYLALDAQGVLFLSGWLGMDAQNQGRRVYRWLDAVLTFQGDTPRAGECVEYDIQIVDSFRNGDSLLFKTEFQASTNGRPLLKIERCTAGFFTYEELATGAGIGEQHKAVRQPATQPFVPPLAPPTRALETRDLVALAHGDIAGVLSGAHAAGGPNPSLRLSPTITHMIERIPYIRSTGGVCGLGGSMAEFTLDPQHWAVRAHFKDDPVFPGPCMLEGAFQLLQVHALALGLGRGLRGARFQPVCGRPVQARFRAQVLPRGQVFGYRADIIEIGLDPEPYLIADIDLIDAGRVTGRIEGLGVRLVGTPVHHAIDTAAVHAPGVLA
ncbi:beta-ketoacyl synthase N-terminal-like domain-containing protein [Paraburkholderia megapolitana]|uniref:beta-ketoacyl synthase N-terminal-like domain-containing protein n=1 Tax=Paraburkholderia megapolitana TaxID=420953 RepID=UPI0038B9BE9B